jgi:DNA repair protein RecN (Recombination protein N)
MPWARARPVTLSARQRGALEQLTRAAGTSQAIATRARIVLAAADGASNRALAQRLHLARNTAQAWRDRWVAAAEALAAAHARAGELAAQLRSAREGAADAFAAAVAHELAGVGMGDGEFAVELREREHGVTGCDDAVFLVRPNRGLPFAPVAETASGGELSRIALAIAAVGGGDTMIFDEIDAGIGGTTAHAVGETLRRLAGRAQVITITHLPQIASLADRHFRVEKIAGDPTHTRIDLLGDDERRAELQRMLGGEEFLAAVR